MRENSFEKVSRQVGEKKKELRLAKRNMGLAISSLRGSETDRDYLTEQIKELNAKISALRSRRREVDLVINKTKQDLAAESVKSERVTQEIDDLRAEEVKLIKEAERNG